MIVQPMGGKTKEEIAAAREKAAKALEEKGYEVVNTFFDDEWYEKQTKPDNIVQHPLFFLSKSLEVMSCCNTVYLCRGWENARGCKIEHDAAVAYGLDIIYEE